EILDEWRMVGAMGGEQLTPATRDRVLTEVESWAARELGDLSEVVAWDERYLIGGGRGGGGREGAARGGGGPPAPGGGAAGAAGGPTDGRSSTHRRLAPDGARGGAGRRFADPRGVAGSDG